jgi:hypothetical protein
MVRVKCEIGRDLGTDPSGAGQTASDHDARNAALAVARQVHYLAAEGPP